MQRTDLYTTPERDRWLEVIKFTVLAIDNHEELYRETADIWHRKKAESLRSYVSELKTYITTRERKLGVLRNNAGED